MQIRSVNERCLDCGAEVPRAVEVEESEDYRRYICPSCGSSIAEAIISTDGEPATSPYRPPFKSMDYIIREDIEWDTWEVWWTDYNVAVLIHGTMVSEHTDEKMLKLIDALEHLHDSNK
jgi:DNA-directed RNA polymerase subunit RPC12/RpoP